jgi:SagB-type dehydrogenase family enzyme
MNLRGWKLLLPVLAVVLIIPGGCGESKAISTAAEDKVIVLPEPARNSDTSLEEALLGRRSVRNFGSEAMTLKQVGQLLWAGQGITSSDGKRTAPSAGALYPLEVYVVIGNVEGAASGVYKYEPSSHTLTRVIDGDQRDSLAQAAVGQTSVRQGAIDIVIAAVYEITTVKYGERGVMYVHIEAGHAAQNICLQAVALKLGTVTVGAFDDAGVQKVLMLPEDEVPLYIIPAGNFTD